MLLIAIHFCSTCKCIVENKCCLICGICPQLASDNPTSSLCATLWGEEETLDRNNWTSWQVSFFIRCSVWGSFGMPHELRAESWVFKTARKSTVVIVAAGGEVRHMDMGSPQESYSLCWGWGWCSWISDSYSERLPRSVMLIRVLALTQPSRLLQTRRLLLHGLLAQKLLVLLGVLNIPQSHAANQCQSFIRKCAWQRNKTLC